MPENTVRNSGEESAYGHTVAGKLGILWCDLMHDSPMWPIHGQYLCRTCGRPYRVPWAAENPLPAAANLAATGAASMRSVLKPFVLLFVLLTSLVLTSPVRAADSPIVESTGGASMAFARYVACQEQATPWGLETVEIDASLPKLEKHGRLRAIRRLIPFGKPEYQVLELAGDRTVRQQVILRYLSTEARAAALPASSVAITPANYKFRYKGSVTADGAVTYGFQITPRKKREGLIKGELWIDGDSGAAVRQSGRLVKSSSIFVKHIDVSREIVRRNGIAEMRVTHLSVDTRLVGRAELTVYERLGTDPDGVPAPRVAEQ